jgi:hypothetical protein
LEASIKSSAEIFSAIVGMVMSVRSAWSEAANEQLKQPRRESDLSGVPYPPPAAADEATTHGGWTA